MSLETFVRNGDHVVLIMPFFEHDKFQVCCHYCDCI